MGYVLLARVGMCCSQKSTYTNQFESTDLLSMNLSSWLTVAYLECLLSCFRIWFYFHFVLHLCLLE